MFSRHLQSRVRLAAVLVVVAILGKVGFLLGTVEGVPVVWPASGVALVAMLVFGYSVWPAIVLGTFLASVDATGEVAYSIAVGVGAGLEAFVGTVLIDRLAGGALALGRSDAQFRFVAVVALAAAPTAAALAAATGAATGNLSPRDLGTLWITTWLGHLSGTLVVVPFVALWLIGPFETVPRSRMVQATAVGALITIVAIMVFGGWLPVGRRHYPLEFLSIPFLIWAARLGRREAATAVMILVGIAVWGTFRGFGPFAQSGQWSWFSCLPA
jgi:integral membrane sensor domain MASE1